MSRLVNKEPRNLKIEIWNLELTSRTMHCALLIVFLATLLASPVFAQNPTPTDDEVNKIAKQLFCPICQSTPLDVCPEEACRQWRELIREMLAQGKSEAEIKQYFVEHYGPQVLNEPPNRLLTYAVPIAIFLFGAFILFRGFQTWKKPIATGSESVKKSRVADRRHDQSDANPAQDPYIAKLEEELKKRS